MFEAYDTKRLLTLLPAGNHLIAGFYLSIYGNLIGIAYHF